MMYRFSRYRSQYAANLRLALPVMLTQLGQILVQFADNLMVGHYGGDDPVPLAAVAFGGSVFFILFIAGIGVAMGLTPLVGELFAQGDRRISARYLHNAVVFFTLLGVAIAALQYALIPFMHRMGQPAEVVTEAIPYYRMLLFSMPFVMLFYAFKQFLEGVGNTKVEMVIVILCNIANVGFNWLFIYGNLSFPEMGAAGAGLGTLLSRMMMPAMMLYYFFTRPRYRIYLRGFSFGCLRRRSVGALLRMGIPISMQMFLESSAFVGTGIMMGWFGSIPAGGAEADAAYGAVALSANQIAMTLGNCAFMIVTSIGAATTIRVSHCYGARRTGEMALASHASYHLVLAWNALAAIVFLTGRHWIPHLFTTNTAVIETAGALLALAALYQLSDGLQNVSVGILRGMQDVRAIAPIAFVSYWILNLPIGYLLGFVLGMGPQGLYVGFTFGLTVAALLYMARIRRSMGRMRRGRWQAV